MLIDIVRDCQHVQETPEGLFRKTSDMQYIKRLFDKVKYTDKKDLTGTEMLVCNDIYKRYKKR